MQFCLLKKWIYWRCLLKKSVLRTCKPPLPPMIFSKSFEFFETEHPGTAASLLSLLSLFNLINY